MRFEHWLPWARRHHDDDPLGEVDIDTTMVFVPAIMSVGLIFSIVTLLRDLFRWSGGRARARRTAMEAGAVLGELLGREEPEPEDIGILSRPSYLITALALVGGAAYVAIGSTANFLRDGGYVRNIGWLLAISLILSVALGFLGGVALAVYRTWPHPPSWALVPLRVAPLTTTPGRSDVGPSWALSSAIGASALATGVIALIVGSGRSVALDIDRPIARWIVEAEWVHQLRFVDPFGSTVISIGFVVLIGVAGFRCRVIALAYPVAFLVAWLSSAAIREIVERPRPFGAGDVESFPSGHLVQAVFIAGLVPLAVQILFSAPRVALVIRAGLAIGVAASALHRIHVRSHYPLDVVAGIGLGLTVVLATQWVIDHRAWHDHCSSCPWSPHPDDARWRRGVFRLGQPTIERVRWAGVIGAVLAATGLAVATQFIGLPTDPEGYGLASAISHPAQLGLAGLMAFAGLLAIRWQALAAFLMAFTAAGLGLLASIEYPPMLTFVLTMGLLIPAVLTWLAWQPNETVGAISALAALTISVLVATTLGSREIYNHFFGPTHPGSTAEQLDLGEGDWVWLGAVSPTGAKITVGGVDDDDQVALRLWPDGRPEDATLLIADPDEHGLARFEFDDLEPGTRYRYGTSDLDDIADPGSGSELRVDPAAAFRTFEDGPQDLVVAVASCARVGSDGAVFDAIVDADPDLYLSVGDMHYANLESTDPADAIGQYGNSLSRPGQAALYSSVPTAYVWDDHDFGPNDADSSSPSRAAAGEAYRLAVPNYGVDPDIEAPIAQAFTVGRVRFVFTDTRSQRDPTTMLGADQLTWLIDELIASSADHRLVVWANPTPWVGADHSGAEDWSTLPDERRRISQALEEAGVDNLVMVSGDAHMVAIDDGTNTNYSDLEGPGFPLLHAAPLDRPGSIKGGPYSEGTFTEPGQFGLVEIHDDGGETIEVRLSGRTWDGRELVSHEFTLIGPAAGRR